MLDEACVVLMTASNEEAAPLCRALVEERLIACANIIPQVRSIYRWEGEVKDEGEAWVVMKTRSSLFQRLSARVLELHSYQVPELLRLAVAEGHPPYLEWIFGSVCPEP